MAFSQEELQIIEYGKKSGKNPQEIKDAVFRFRTTGSPVDPNKPQPEQTSTAQDVGIGLAKFAGDNLRSGMDVAAAAPGMLASTLPGGELVRPAIDAGVGALRDRAQGALGLTNENLASSNPTQTATKIGATVATIASPFVLASFAKLASRAPKALSIAEAPSVKGLIQKGEGALQKGVSTVKEAVQNPKLALAKQNVDPRLESSAQRLFLKGTERLEDPVAAYDTYVSQAKNAINDIKVDPPLATVGESIGDAFRTVVQRRRDVGKTLEAELKKTAANPVPLKGTLQTFQQELIDNGVAYDAVDKRVISSSASKFSDADRSILELYASDLQKLGSNPSMRDLDAFVSRIPSEIEGLKASRNLKTVSNAERIIGNHLRGLRTALTEAGTPEYAAARTQYSELSNFIDEGSQYLGKVTQDGDFARDASLIKSSVQSLLNNGKKDWLTKLEELTEYPAIDDGVLALQAMKDAGDFRGQSLLQLLSEGQAPTSASSITQKAIDFAMQKAGRAIGGTPEEQTRTFLQSLKQGAGPQSSANTMNAVAGAGAGVDPEDQSFDPAAGVAGAAAAMLGIKLQKGSVEKVRRVINNATPVDYEQIKDFLKIMEGPGLNNKLQALDNYAPFLKRFNLDSVEPDELVNILNRVMMDAAN
jgi:hypothetical protein